MSKRQIGPSRRSDQRGRDETYRGWGIHPIGRRSATRALSLTAAIVAAASLAGFAQSTASAAPPTAVSIQIHPTVFGPVQVGTWEASGAINDSGTYVRTVGRTTPSIPDCVFLGTCLLEHTGAFKEEFLLTGSLGTLTVKAEEQLKPTGELFPPSSGVWQIKSGTGAYDRTSGHGTSEFITASLTLSLAGVASKVG